MKLTKEALAQIRERCEKGLTELNISNLLSHIEELERENEVSLEALKRIYAESKSNHIAAIAGDVIWPNKKWIPST